MAAMSAFSFTIAVVETHVVVVVAAALWPEPQAVRQRAAQARMISALTTTPA
jgi:hypothetical protein